MNLSASNDVRIIFQGYVEELNRKLPHFKTLLSLTCLYTIVEVGAELSGGGGARPSCIKIGYRSR